MGHVYGVFVQVRHVWKASLKAFCPGLLFLFPSAVSPKVIWVRGVRGLGRLAKVASLPSALMIYPSRAMH